MRPWSSQDDGVLKKELRRGGIWKMRVSQAVGRSVGNVEMRTYLLINRGEISQALYDSRKQPAGGVPSQRWSALEVVELKRLHGEWRSYVEIAQILHRPLSGVRAKGKKIGLRGIDRIGTYSARTRGDAWGERDLVWLRDALASGASIEACARELGRSVHAIEHKIRMREVRRHCSPWSDDDRRMLRKLFARGCTDAMIAEQLGRSPRAVRQRRYVMGLARGEG